MIFLCQCKDLDDEDDWFAVHALDAEHAALIYIERCEEMSGGAMLVTPETDTETVNVKDEKRIVTTFEITADYEKIFFAVEKDAVS